MLDLNLISKRYFDIKIGDLILEVEPPTIKVLKKITAISKVKNEDSMDELAEVISLILNKNKEGYEVPKETIDKLDQDQLNAILIEFFEWLGKTKNSKN